MPRIRVVTLGLMSATLMSATLAACQKPAPPSEPSPSSGNEPAVAASAADLPDTSAPNESGAADAGGGITMRYTCDDGRSVAIVRGEIARITLDDDRVVEIKRVADSSPPRYSGEALSFEVGSKGATLGQDEVGGTACREAD